MRPRRRSVLLVGALGAVAAATSGWLLATPGAADDGADLTFTRQHIGDVIIVTLLVMVASVVVSLIATVVGTLLCLVGLIVTIPAGTLITYLIQAHLYAQVGMGRGTHLATTDETAVSPAPEPAPVMVAAPVVETATTAPTVQPEDQAPTSESE